jgi:RsiW-degrading membrane proteinase PrsW (M82 family)
MSIQWHCACGKRLKAPESAAGKRARCPACQEINQIPQTPAPEPDEVFDPFNIAEPSPPELDQEQPEPIAAPPPYRRPEPASAATERLPVEATLGGRSWRDFNYLILLLAMLPLVFSSFKSSRVTLGEQLKESVQAHPEVKERLRALMGSEESTIDDVIDVFPGGKLDGAFLPRKTAAHWVFAGISAALFLTLMMFLFRPGSARPKSLLLTGLFTGTVGILLLIAFQYIASFALATGFRNIPHGKGAILFLIVKFIGFSYQAAENPENGFLLSCLGFTFGVGLCEELCKALPLLWLMRKRPEQATWRGACLWGLASGVGFGVAEGIMYSGRYYNGMLGGDIYLVRFASCVALHAVWSASVAIMLYKNRDKLANAPGTSALLGYGLVYAGGPMLLHGLYDTLLKKDHSLVALGIALASFAYLAALIEWSMRRGEIEYEGRQPAYSLPGRHTVR